MIADDSAIVRDRLAAVLSAAGLTVAAVAQDPEALATVNRTMPDVAIVDIRMPPMHTDEGLRAAEQLRRKNPRIGILVLSRYAEPRLVAHLLEAAPDGRVGYLLKDRVSDLDILIDALRRINSGETIIDAVVSERMINRRARQYDLDELTPRELGVLGLLAEGRSKPCYRRCAGRHPKRARGTHSQIFLKLGLRDAPDEHRRVAAVLAYLNQTA